MKLTVFNVRETTKMPLFAFMFFKEIIAKKPNFNHYNEIQSFFYLRNDFLFIFFSQAYSTAQKYCKFSSRES